MILQYDCTSHKRSHVSSYVIHPARSPTQNCIFILKIDSFCILSDDSTFYLPKPCIFGRKLNGLIPLSPQLDFEFHADANLDTIHSQWYVNRRLPCPVNLTCVAGFPVPQTASHHVTWIQIAKPFGEHPACRCHAHVFRGDAWVSSCCLP